MNEIRSNQEQRKQQLRTRPLSRQVLILTPGDQLLYDAKGQRRELQLGQDKIRGPLQVIELTELVETTFGNMEGFTETEVKDAVMLDPAPYLPKESTPQDLYIDVKPTRNEQDTTAALIAYAPRTAIQDLMTQLGSYPTYFVPALSAVASDYLRTALNAVILQVGDSAMTGMLISDGKIRARVRDIIAPQRVSEQAVALLSTLAGLSNNDVSHVGLTGRPDYTLMIEEALAEDQGLVIKVFTPDLLAECALHNHQILTISPKFARKANPFPLIALGLILGLLPALLLQLSNHNTRLQIDYLQGQRAKLQADIDTADRLNQEIAQVTSIQTRAQAIQAERVDWYQSLQKLTSTLPQQNDQYSVRLRSLDAKISNPPTPTSASTSTTPTSSQSPAISLNSITTSKPLVTYDLELTAISRDAANKAIANFEHSYNFQLAGLKHNTDEKWDFTATATETK